MSAPYLAGIPGLPARLLARKHEQLSHADRIREQLLVAELRWRIRLARENYEAQHGLVDVKPPTMPDYQ